VFPLIFFIIIIYLFCTFLFIFCHLVLFLLLLFVVLPFLSDLLDILHSYRNMFFESLLFWLIRFRIHIFKYSRSLSHIEHTNSYIPFNLIYLQLSNLGAPLTLQKPRYLQPPLFLQITSSHRT